MSFDSAKTGCRGIAADYLVLGGLDLACLLQGAWRQGLLLLLPRGGSTV